MSFRQARDAKARRGGGALRLSFERHDWGFADEAGEAVEGRGYALRDGERSLAWTSPRLAERGVEVLKVAGTSHRLQELQDRGFLPGSSVVLRPEPDNPHDPNAVGVWNEAGTVQAGYVPRELAAAVAARLGEVEALALWEWRSADGRRFGLRILVAPPDLLAERPPRLARDEPRADEPSLRTP
ncbi:MAG TPA: HIRAN domain-containing protein [Gaiellaceae bacterium]|nr:HIRAN domain-containing protein [Gaiellaceae bacterium]